MNRILILFLAGGIISLTACKKEAGSGGTSAIKGTLTGKTYSGSGGNAAEAEVTQITLPHGSDINDGEYILLNTPDGGNLYYLWFKWDNGVQPDPGLTGRTGIQVTFDFTQSNTIVAANAATAISNIAGSDFTVTVNNDIVTLTNTATGEVTDADELSDNLLVDIQNQGQDAVSGSSGYTEGPIADERVYIVYGDNTFYSEDVRTDAAGNYEFTGLNRGNYTLYAFSTDTLTGQTVQVETTVEITEKKEIVTASELQIVK